MAASKQRSQKLFPLLLLLCMVAAWKQQSSFVGLGSYRRQPKTSRWAVCAQVKEPPAEGDRVVVDGDDGPIVVAKIDGKYYAVDAKCPHLGLPMKQGKIANGPDGPTLTCNFHNSEFNMKSGVCTKWVTGALGFQNDFISGVMSNVGSEKKNVQAYEVVEAEDGSLSIVMPS
mmetsp:Transcript_40637/g.63835  ORF Transcript_40637/g.63835 Transcript_40637/m.63835 type:complete len:172 (-) Transcript_40637:202-717(-)